MDNLQERIEEVIAEIHQPTEMLYSSEKLYPKPHVISKWCKLIRDMAARIGELEKQSLEEAYVEANKLTEKKKVSITLHYKGLDYTIKSMRLAAKIKHLEAENAKLREELQEYQEESIIIKCDPEEMKKLQKDANKFYTELVEKISKQLPPKDKE